MKLGPYEVLSEIGRGGMGVVYRARSPRGDDVAIKVLLRLNAETLGRFDRERRLLDSLGEAEGFVPLIDSGRTAVEPFLVMPFVGGGTLRAMLDQGKLAIEETVRIGRALAAIMGRAHERGVVHRDLKPENVLFTEEGPGSGPARPLITDLGLAKHFRTESLAAESRSLSMTGVFRGTAGYMAPEQMEDAKSVGPSADVFALGAILYECLAGEPAFVGATPLDILTSVSKRSVVPLRKLRPDVPRWLEDAIARSLAPEPERRFASGSELERALVGQATERRRGPIVAALGLALLGAVLVPVALRWQRERAARVLCAEGARLLEKSDWAEADLAFERALALDPRLALAWRGVAEACVRQGRDEQARQAIGRALELAPDLASAHRVLGWIRLREDDYAGCLAASTRAVELDPKDALAWANRARALHGRGDFRGSRDDARKAIELAPTLAWAWYNLANALTSLGDGEGAAVALERAIEDDPTGRETDGLAWRARGVTRLERGDAAGAVDDLTRVIRLRPDSAGFHNRAAAYERAGDLERALSDESRAIELAPTSAISWAQRSKFRFLANDYARAVEDADRALELDPKSAVAHAYRGQAYELLGKPGAAIDDYERLLVELAPGDESVAVFRGRLESLKKSR